MKGQPSEKSVNFFEIVTSKMDIAQRIENTTTQKKGHFKV